MRETGHTIEDMPVNSTVDTIDSNNTEFEEVEVESKKNDSLQRIQEILDGISVNIAELVKNFCNVSTENIIEDLRTRSQAKQAKYN